MLTDLYHTLLPRCLLKLHCTRHKLLKWGKGKKGTGNEDKTTAIQEKKFFSECHKYKVKGSRGFRRRESFGLRKSGPATGRPGIFRWMILAFHRNQLCWFYHILAFGFSVWFHSTTLADCSMVRTQSWVPGSFLGGSIRSVCPLSPYCTYDCGQPSYVVNMYLGREWGRRGCWEQSTAQTWWSHPFAHVIKHRPGGQPVPASCQPQTSPTLRPDPSGCECPYPLSFCPGAEFFRIPFALFLENFHVSKDSSDVEASVRAKLLGVFGGYLAPMAVGDRWLLLCGSLRRCGARWR